VTNNQRRWRYVQSILERLEGERWPADPRQAQKLHQGDTEAERFAERYQRGKRRKATTK